MRGTFLSDLGIAHPIILAPMAGAGGTPELVAAVSNAGGLGSWGGAYSTPQQILDAAKQICALTAKPFASNLFAGGYEPQRHVDAAPMLALVARVHETLGLPPPLLPPNPASPFDDQVAAVIEARPALFSFTFGIPSADVLARLRQAGIRTCGTATTVVEGKKLEGAGVDFIVAQGEEAGAHRGSFLESFERSMVPMRELSRTTVITRVDSGRPARGLRNAFIDMADGVPILPFRQQNDLTRPMRNESGKQGNPEYISLWAGRNVTRVRAMSAAKLMETLVAEIGRR